MAQRKPPSLFLRTIYKIYRHGSTLKHLRTSTLLPPGILILLLIPLPWLLLPLHNQASIWQLRAILLVTPVISAIWLIFRRGKVSVTRDTPKLATVGQPISYQVTIRNESSTPLRGATVTETPVDNRPSLHAFCYTREPYEETRNIFDRVLSFYRWLWLEEQLTLFEATPTAPIPELKPNDQHTAQISLTPIKRGVIELSDIRLCLQDPLGLLQKCRPNPSSFDTITILPRRYSIPPMTLGGNAQLQSGGNTVANTQGQSGDFTSIREYKPGDPIKHIHWKSWARTGKPIVKEYENLTLPRYALALDTFGTTYQSDQATQLDQFHSFEDAVSIAASFAASIQTQQSALDTLFIGQQAHRFASSQDEATSAQALEILARASLSDENHSDDLEALIIKQHKDLSLCIIIFTGWCEQRRQTVIRLHQAGIKLHIIALCRDLASAQEIHNDHPVPVNICWIRQSHIQQDLALMLTH